MQATQQNSAQVGENDGLPGKRKHDHAAINFEKKQHSGRPRNAALNVRPGKVKLSALNSRDWNREFSDFLHTFGRVRIRDFGKKASEGTFKARSTILFSCIRTLVDAGIVTTLSQVHPRCIPYLMECWDKKGVGKRTQNNYFCALHWFWTMCAVPVKEIGTFAKYQGQFTVNRNAEFDKSWSGNNVDFHEIYELVRIDDPIGADILLTIKTFGLRPKEAVCLRPHESDLGNRLHILHGSKTGRERLIPFENLDEAICREVLAKLKSQVSVGDHIAWKDRTLKQAMERVYTLTRKYGLRKTGKYGVTLYGLRHQFAIENYEKLTGQLAPVRGGTAINYRAIIEGASKVSESLGHHRLDVLGAYCGSARSAEGQQRRNMKQAWARMEQVLNGAIGALLSDNGIENLYWIGELAIGKFSRTGTYELVIPGNVDIVLAASLMGKIEDMIITATGMQCTVQHWACMAQVKQILWADQAVPLYRHVSPLAHMNSLLAEQRKARLKGCKRAFDRQAPIPVQ